MDMDPAVLRAMLGVRAEQEAAEREQRLSAQLAASQRGR